MSLKTIVNHMIAFVIGTIAFFIFFAIWASAHAQEDRRWLHQGWKKSQYHRKAPRVYSWRSEESSSESRCLGRLIAGTGQEAASEDSALKSAERNWGALVRYDFAEKLMDLKFAERYSSRCQRSSTGESATAKIVGGVTEAFTGKDATILYRCRVWADPCTAPKTTDGARDR